VSDAGTPDDALYFAERAAGVGMDLSPNDPEARGVAEALLAMYYGLDEEEASDEALRKQLAFNKSMLVDLLDPMEPYVSNLHATITFQEWALEPKKRVLAVEVVRADKRKKNAKLYYRRAS